jgi:hypothetical protein
LISISVGGGDDNDGVVMDDADFETEFDKSFAAFAGGRMKF